MSNSINEQKFQQVVEAFDGQDPIGSGELYLAAGYFMDIAAHGIAMSILQAAAELHTTGWIDGEKTYTEIFLETFRRAIYDRECAARYGYVDLSAHPTIVDLITTFLLDRASLEDENPLARAMSANVVMFPGTFTKQ